MPFHRQFPVLAVACALLLAGCGSEAKPVTNTTSLPINYAPSPTVADLNGGVIATAQAAVDAKPQDATAWYRLGNAISVAANEITDDNLRQASYNKAIAAYLRALELNPADGAAMHNLGTAYLQIGKLTDARKQFETALTVDAQDPKTLYMLGTIYLQEDPFGSSQSNQRAREKFEAALTVDPKLAVAHVGLAQVYLNEGDVTKALENARKGVELSGDQVDPFTYWQLAQAQCASGDAAGGTETLQRILAAAVPNAMFNEQVRSLMSACK